MRKLAFLAFALILAGIHAAPAAAQYRGGVPQPASGEYYQGTEAQRQACTPDAMRLCGQFIPDAGMISACLRAQKPNLTPDCRAVFEGRLR